MLSAHAFTWERYAGQWGYSSDKVWDYVNNCPKTSYLELGRVDSMSLPYRPREGIAVMLEDTQTFERFWLHIYI